MAQRDRMPSPTILVAGALVLGLLAVFMLGQEKPLSVPVAEVAPADVTRTAPAPKVEVIESVIEQVKAPWPPPPPGAKPWEDEAALEESRTQKNLYKSAKVSAVYANEDLLGVRIRNVAPGSFWSRVGFRHGDVILEANGELMDSPQASVNFMNALATSYVLIVRVRGEDGEERMLEFRTNP